MAETIRLHNLETDERIEVTEESAEKLLKRDNFVPDEGSEKSSEEIGEVEKLGEKTVWDEIDEELDKEQPNELPPKWKPSENDEHPSRLKGVVDRTGPNKYGKSLIIEDLDGNEWFIPSGRKALEDFIKKRGSRRQSGTQVPRRGGKRRDRAKVRELSDRRQEIELRKPAMTRKVR